MKKYEQWAIASERFDEFFCELEDVERNGAGFTYRSCRISIEKLPERSVGGFSFPQTKISFEGEDEDVSCIYRRFFMRFVSAGG